MTDQLTLDGTALVAAGVAAVDSHVKLVRGTASDAAALAAARAEAQARLRTELGALLAEARDAAESGALAVAPSRSLGWLRVTVEAARGTRSPTARWLPRAWAPSMRSPPCRARWRGRGRSSRLRGAATSGTPPGRRRSPASTRRRWWRWGGPSRAWSPSTPA